MSVPLDERRLRFVPLMALTHYWRGRIRATRAGRTTALGALCDVLALDSSRWLPRKQVPVRDQVSL